MSFLSEIISNIYKAIVIPEGFP